MAQSSKKTSRKLGKVDFYQHFPKDFLRPYGKAVVPTDLTDHFCLSKIKPFTCEWLCRPGYAISEAAETIYRNKDVDELVEDVFDARARGKFMEILERIQEQSLPFWSDEANPSSQAVTMTRDESKKRLKRLSRIMKYTSDGSEASAEVEDGDFFQEYVRAMTELGGSLYLMGIHLRMMSYTLKHPDKMATKAVESANMNAFVKKPSVKSLSLAILGDYTDKASASRVRDTPTKRRSVKRFLEQENDSDDE